MASEKVKLVKTIVERRGEKVEKLTYAPTRPPATTQTKTQAPQPPPPPPKTTRKK